MRPTTTYQQFLERARKTHSEKYTYSEDSYKGTQHNITITCEEHGDFSQNVSSHLKGAQCPKCANLHRVRNRRLTFKEFHSRAERIHDHRYSYQEADLETGSESIVEITCREHGTFEQKVKKHLEGQGCPTCARLATNKSNALTFKEFEKRSKEKHGSLYEYVEKGFSGARQLTTIVCKEHGAFRQRAAQHLRGQGCKACAITNKADHQTYTFDEAVDKAKTVHGGKYAYLGLEGGLLTIECNDHGVFTQQYHNHVQGSGCRKCSNNGTSNFEKELLEFLSPYNAHPNYRLPLEEGKVLRNAKRNVHVYAELDVYIPSKNLAVEANGLYWHNFDRIGKHYHADKLQVCNERGVDLIQIFEDEWVYKQDIVKSIILTRLGKYERRIFARKTVKETVSVKQAKEFYEANHIQGYANAEKHEALTLDGEIVAMASFGKRESLFKHSEMELIRYCTTLNTQVVGGLSKLISEYKILRTYCDLRLFNGNGYKACGFVEDYVTKPDYYYTKHGKRFSRYAFQKHKLAAKLEKYDENLTEAQNMTENGYKRIFGCGNMALTRYADI